MIDIGSLFWSKKGFTGVVVLVRQQQEGNCEVEYAMHTVVQKDVEFSRNARC
jgi:hypothetical protein